MISEIANNDRSAADILFLIAAIILFVEFLVYLLRPRIENLPTNLRLDLAAFGLIAIAFLLL